MRTGGRVTETFQRPWEGREGTITLHSFKIEGDNRFYRTGTDVLCDVNDLVEFEFDTKGNVSNLNKTGEASTPPPSQQTRRPYGGGGTGKSSGGFKQKQAEKDQYWKDKEDRDVARERRQQEVVEPRITWSSAQSDAVALVTAALQHDCLVFGNANKSAKLGLLLDYVDQVTRRFAQQRWQAAELLEEAIADDTDDGGAPDDRIPYDDQLD